MFENIEELIDHNLRLIVCHKNSFYITDFTTLDNKPIEIKEECEFFADEMAIRGLIECRNELCLVKKFGYTVQNEFGGWLKYQLNQYENNRLYEVKENARIELEIKKMKADLRIAENILKEHSRNKWFGIIGFIIALILAIKELFIWITPLIF